MIVINVVASPAENWEWKEGKEPLNKPFPPLVLL